MDRRWSSEYHFLSKLYNKLLHRPTNDVVNFRGRGWVECACIRWERSRKRTNHGAWFIRASNFLWKFPLSEYVNSNTQRHNLKDLTDLELRTLLCQVCYYCIPGTRVLVPVQYWAWLATIPALWPVQHNSNSTEQSNSNATPQYILLRTRVHIMYHTCIA